MTREAFIDSLKKVVAPELNHLLTEAPKLPGDFGWFCREHAVITTALSRAFGFKMEIVYGDVSIIVGAASCHTLQSYPRDKHWWCRGLDLPVIDLSARLDFFSQKCKKHAPVMGDGVCGSFGVLITEDHADHKISYDRPYIVYTPIRSETDSIEELLTTKAVVFLKGRDAAKISRQIFIHIRRLLAGSALSYIGRMNQQKALFDLERINDSTQNVFRHLRSSIT